MRGWIGFFYMGMKSVPETSVARRFLVSLPLYHTSPNSNPFDGGRRGTVPILDFTSFGNAQLSLSLF